MKQSVCVIIVSWERKYLGGERFLLLAEEICDLVHRLSKTWKARRDVCLTRHLQLRVIKPALFLSCHPNVSSSLPLLLGVFLYFLLDFCFQCINVLTSHLHEFFIFGVSDGKEFACHAREGGLIPGLGRSPGGEHGNPLQYSCLENSMDRGAWWAIVHQVAKSQTQLNKSHYTAQ